MNDIKQKVYANILISVSIILTMFYFGLVYFVEEEKALSLEMVNKRKEIEQLKSQSEQIGEIRGVYREWQKKTETILESVVRHSELFNYIIEIKDLASENNVKLEVVVSTEDKGEVDSSFSYTYYKIKATGHFSDIMKFLVCIENLKYYSEMENISFVINDESRYNVVAQDSEEILFSADLKIYMNQNDKFLSLE